MTAQMLIIGIIAAGDMGSAVAARLTAGGSRVLTDLSGRSEATKARAAACGMEDCSLSDIVKQAGWLLSIVPPSDAEHLAKAAIAAIEEASQSKREGWAPPVYVDCNAKNPVSTLRLTNLFTTSACTDLVFLNACIIGLPPKADHNPTFYASAASDPRSQQALQNFEKLSAGGLKTRVLCGEGSDICDASSLKMTFSGIMKGMIAIWETMILCEHDNDGHLFSLADGLVFSIDIIISPILTAAHAHSPATSHALLTEMQNSLSQDLLHIDKYVTQAHPKAYRFVREMKEMSGFVHEHVGNGSIDGPEGSAVATSSPAQVFDGFAALYARVADSHRGQGHSHSDGQSDVEVLNTFVRNAAEGRRVAASGD